MSALSSICIFCGSGPGTSPGITEGVRALGTILAERKITLVTGGGGRGLMAVVADAALAAGGKVIGVMPRDMVVREWAHPGLTEMRLVDTMHERKALMAELSGAFLALPGGIGTMDEFFEIWTWHQIGLHTKRIGMLNIEGYFDHLLAMVDHMVRMEFLSAANRNDIVVDQDPTRLLRRLLE